MTPKEKANDLLNTFIPECPYADAIRYSLKICNEVLREMGSDRGYIFWNDVKQYLINLK